MKYSPKKKKKRKKNLFLSNRRELYDEGKIIQHFERNTHSYHMNGASHYKLNYYDQLLCEMKEHCSRII